MHNIELKRLRIKFEGQLIYDTLELLCVHTEKQYLRLFTAAGSAKRCISNKT
jgi:hypothetical protein